MKLTKGIKVLFKNKEGVVDKKENVANIEAIAYFQKGVEKYILHDFRNAIDYLSYSLKSDPNNPRTYNMRGNVFEDMGDDISAEKDFLCALELSPNDYLPFYRIGMIYFRKKDFQTSANMLHQSFLNADEDNKNVKENNSLFVSKRIIACNLGNALVQLKCFEDGIKFLDEALKIDPNYVNPYVTKGLALFQLGNKEEALKNMRIAQNLGYQQASQIIQMMLNN